MFPLFLSFDPFFLDAIIFLLHCSFFLPLVLCCGNTLRDPLLYFSRRDENPGEEIWNIRCEVHTFGAFCGIFVEPLVSRDGEWEVELSCLQCQVRYICLPKR